MDNLSHLQFRYRPDSRWIFFLPAGLALLIFAGVVLGVITAARIPEAVPVVYTTTPPLSAALVLRRFISLYKYHLIVFFIGLSFLGVFLIPLLTLLRGFLLAFSVAAVWRSGFADGIGTLLAFYGVQLLLVLPSFLWLSAVSFETSVSLAGGLLGRGSARSPLNVRLLLVLLATTSVVMLCAVLDCTLTPYLYQIALSL